MVANVPCGQKTQLNGMDGIADGSLVMEVHTVDMETSEAEWGGEDNTVVILVISASTERTHDIYVYYMNV